MIQDTYSLMKLPVLPEKFQTKDSLPYLSYYAGVQCGEEISKTHTTIWCLVLMLVGSYHVAYRVKLRDDFGYGG
jgi:hypothetical protein